MCSLNSIVGGVIQTTIITVTAAGKGGGAKRGNPAMRDEHTLAHCYENHNSKLTETSWVVGLIVGSKYRCVVETV